MSISPSNTGLSLIVLPEPTDATCGQCSQPTGPQVFRAINDHTDEPVCARCLATMGPAAEPLKRLIVNLEGVARSTAQAQAPYRPALALVAFSAVREWATRYASPSDETETAPEQPESPADQEFVAMMATAFAKEVRRIDAFGTRTPLVNPLVVNPPELTGDHGDD